MTPAGNPAPSELITGWDHLEFWVGNARQFAHFLASGFGFDITAYAGPETGSHDRSSYVLESGAVRIVVTGVRGFHDSDYSLGHQHRDVDCNLAVSRLFVIRGHRRQLRVAHSRHFDRTIVFELSCFFAKQNSLPLSGARPPRAG